MRRLHELRSVGAKLTWIVAIVSGTAVLLAALAMGLRTYAHLHRQLAETITSHSMIVAMNSSAPLAFHDGEMAADALSALAVVKDIRRAALIDTQGRVFARFVAPGMATRDVRPYPLGRWRDGRNLVLVVPVADRAGTHGRLQVVYTDRRVIREALTLGLQSALLSIAAMALAWLLAARLRPLLTAPVLELERAARRVRDSGDYSIRARRVSQDELGELADVFNGMLERIESSQQALIDAQQRAEESSRLKDEFVATVSHELRTPLSPVLAWIRMLRHPRGAAELSRGLDVMERNAQSLVRIIDDLLDMSRIVSGTLRLDMGPVDIDAIVRAAVETLAPAAASRGLHIDLDLVAPAPPLRGDAARLQQVVWNLLSNAIKFSPQGGRIGIATRREGTRAEIMVSDRGMGIAPDFLPFVFDRFRQQDGSITRAHGGLGLGLAIVRQVVEQHGGSVRVESAGQGQGATFVVSLPVAEHAAGPAPAARAGVPVPAPTLAGVRVLVVEDHGDMRAIIGAALAGAGALVREAASAEDALALAMAEAPDVLVSDIGLPGMDGYGLLRRLHAAGLHMPALALSAYVHPKERERALAAGYAVHLSKPVEPDTLLAAVAALLPPGAAR